MAFRFRLQSVLEHRHHQQEVAMAAMAVQVKAQHECEQQIAWLEEEFRSARSELAEREMASMSAKDFVLANEYVTVLRLTAMREQARLPGLKAEVEKARLELVEAERKTRVLEKLREKHQAAYDYRQLKMEQHLLDEVAVGAYARSMGS